MSDVSLRRRGLSARMKILIITWLTYAGYYLCRKNLGIALPLLNSKEHIPAEQLANVVFTFSLLYAVSQFVIGPLVDRYGSRRIVGLGLSLVCLSNLLMSFSGPVLWLAILAGLNGLGQATGWSGLVRCMGEWFEAGERGVVMAWWSTNYALGGFLATVFATFAATNTWILPGWGWRRAFIFPALLLFLIELFFLKSVPSSPSQNNPATTDTISEEWHISVWASLRELWRSPVLWIISSSYFLLELIRYAFLFWLPLYLTTQLSYTVTKAGYLASLFELVGVIGSLVAGYLSDRLFQARRFPVGAMMLAGFGVFIFLTPYLARYGMWPTAIGVSMMGIFCYGPDTLLSGTAAQDIGASKHAGTAAGFIDGFGHLGSILSPYAVIYVSGRFGWNNLFLLLAVFALAAAAFLCVKWNFISLKTVTQIQEVPCKTT